MKYRFFLASVMMILSVVASSPSFAQAPPRPDPSTQPQLLAPAPGSPLPHQCPHKMPAMSNA